MRKSGFLVLLVLGLAILAISLWKMEVISKEYIIQIGLLLIAVGVIFYSGKFLGYGLPKSYLPTGKNFKKLWMLWDENVIFFLLEHDEKTLEYDPNASNAFMRRDIRFYWVFARDLRSFFQKVSTLPKEFDIEKTWLGVYRIVPSHHPTSLPEE